jgi:hypothetical protein
VPELQCAPAGGAGGWPALDGLVVEVGQRVLGPGADWRLMPVRVAQRLRTLAPALCAAITLRRAVEPQFRSWQPRSGVQWRCECCASGLLPRR